MRVDRLPRQFKVAWLGPEDEAFAGLCDRLANYRSASIDGVQLIECGTDRDSLYSLIEQGLDRLIYGCGNRLEYPAADLEWLLQEYPELPVALAVNSYWDGWRRTGLVTVPHAVIPWHRWWDGWVDWLEATDANWFGGNIESIKFDGRGNLLRRTTHGAVIAGCPQTAAAWRLAAEQSGAVVIEVDTEPLLNLRENSDLDWILWDDSHLSSVFGDVDLSVIEEACGSIKRALPESQLFVAFQNPRWHVWKALVAKGADELLSKPNTGRALQRILAGANASCRD